MAERPHTNIFHQYPPGIVNMYVFYWLIQITFITQLWLWAYLWVSEWVSAVDAFFPSFFLVNQFSEWIDGLVVFNICTMLSNVDYILISDRMVIENRGKNHLVLEFFKRDWGKNKQKHLIIWSIHCNIWYLFMYQLEWNIEPMSFHDDWFFLYYIVK